MAFTSFMKIFLPKDRVFYGLFEEVSTNLTQMGEIFKQAVSEHDVTARNTLLKTLEEWEHKNDDVTHKIFIELGRNFITPFDREDIYTLAVALDDICDYIDAGVRAIVMYDIQEQNQYSRQLARVIKDLGVEINGAVSVLKKPNNIAERFREIHRLENEADDVYFRAIADLFKNEKDPIAVIKWKEFYEILENATDRCESVANIIESIVLKHN